MVSSAAGVAAVEIVPFVMDPIYATPGNGELTQVNKDENRASLVRSLAFSASAPIRVIRGYFCECPASHSSSSRVKYFTRTFLYSLVL